MKGKKLLLGVALLLIVAYTILLGGCVLALAALGPVYAKHQQRFYIDNSRKLVDERQYEQAIALLEQGVEAYPKNKPIADELKKVRAEYEIVSLERERRAQEREQERLAERDFKVSGSSITGYLGNKQVVNIPSHMSIIEIGVLAFDGHKNITSITIPNSVRSIGSYAFQNCTGLISIEIPDSVTRIGDGAFLDCTSLTSIIIPAGVTRIGEFAFSGCTSLTSINVDANNPNFAGEDGILYNKTKTELKAFPSASGNVTIPASVTSIGRHAFSGCTNLTSITIPASVTTIGEEAFNGCSSLTSIMVAANNPSFSSQDRILYNKTKTAILFVPKAISGSVTIPASVTSIGVYAFGGCKSLTGITLPASITSIGDGAFGNCESLTSIMLPASVTSIGHSVFQNCPSLTSITIPNSVRSIGRAFFGWRSSQTIYVQGKANQAAADAAWGANWRGGCFAQIVYQRP